jgi:hypothetical protein
MELNPETWPELVFNFGPYAILVLFILWVVPRASKRMQNMTETAPKAVRISATMVLIVSWSVVLIMVGYVLFQWSPVRVYSGGLGVLNQSEKIYPLDDNIYIKVEGTPVPKRERWQFVLVDRERALKKEATADFTYYWGEKDDEYTDYFIPISSIVKDKTTEFKFSRKDPEKAYLWSDGQWQEASRETARPQRYVVNLGWNVFAQDGVDLQELKEQLASPNRVVLARARNQLRQLSSKELEALKTMTVDEKALHQIQLELERRQN